MTENEPPHPINVEEIAGKTVGRLRRAAPGRIQERGRKIYRSRGFRVCPPGVYRFHSHEEADEWMRRMAVNRAIEAENREN